MVSHLLDAWMELRKSEQSILTETVEQLSVSPDLASTTLKVLSDAADKLKAQSEFSNVHVLVLVEHKFMSLFSSIKAQDLLASDILLMVLLCRVANKSKNGDYGKKTKEDDILLSRSSAMQKEQDKSADNWEKLTVPTSLDINNLFGEY